MNVTRESQRLAADPHVGALTGWLVALRGVAALEFGRGVCALLWLVLTIKGALVGKLTPNRVIGPRVRWTLESRLAWDEAHRTLDVRCSGSGSRGWPAVSRSRPQHRWC